MSSDDVPGAGVELAAALREAARRLSAAGIATGRADAELLAAHVLGRSRGEVGAAALRGAVLGAADAARLAALVDERSARVPLQHLTGRAPFRQLELRVGPGVFVPRPETEVVAGLAIEEVARVLASGGTAPVAVDLCTGSGAIALAVATEVPAARVVALELDPDAHAWAAANIGDRPELAGRLDLRRGDVEDAADDGGVLADLTGAVDVVVSNPPYIPHWATPVDPEVADHDPALALFGGGEDGLAVPGAVVRTAARLLRPGGLLVMEHADSQGPDARRLVAGAGWAGARTVPDLAGRPRALVVRRAAG